MATGTFQNAMNFKPSAIFVVERKTVGRNIATHYGTNYSITTDISKSGYYPISIVGWYVDNDPEDSANRGSQHTIYRLQRNYEEAIVAIRNNHWNTNGNVAVYIDVLYLKVV